MNVELITKVNPGVALRLLKQGDVFTKVMAAEVTSRTFIVGQWVSLDFPNERYVTDLQTGDVLSWCDTALVFPVANAKFTGEVTCG